MKKLFYVALVATLLFEVLNVYFIMPMPGSQRMNSVGAAYFLYRWRWIFRSILLLLLVAAFINASWKRRWLVLIPVLVVTALVWMLNFKMSADHMFLQPGQLVFAGAEHNEVSGDRLVVGLFLGGKAKAYPIQFIGYHHIIADTVGDTPVLVTYCTVCRTGRVYDPHVNGKVETFRLVGMDHFNAMIEDQTTKSWWRQATGEAITGELKNAMLRQIFSTQTTLSEWLELHPASLIMQRDPTLDVSNRGVSSDYESGKSRSVLTGTDPQSWKDKSWVLGVEVKGIPKAYDWKTLRSKRMIKDKVGGANIVLLLASDNASYFGYQVGDGVIIFDKDTIFCNGHRYRADGAGIDTSGSLTSIPVRQEFWHSWSTFHPGTGKYD